MNARLRAAQLHYDNQPAPLPTDREDAMREWLDACPGKLDDRTRERVRGIVEDSMVGDWL